jgi:thioredoxin-related protein
VYWPDRTDDSGRASKLYGNCQKMIEVLANSAVQSALRQCQCYKVNFQGLDNARRKRYGVKSVPTLLFIDATGKVLKRLTSARIKPASLVRLILTVVKKSDKNMKKLEKKRERAAERAAEKAAEKERS